MDRVYLDMDGTIADLYGEPDWLESIRNEYLYKNLRTIFYDLKPLITRKNMRRLQEDHEVIVLTMVPWGSSKGYNDQVAQDKCAWLKNTFQEDAPKKMIVMEYLSSKTCIKPHIIFSTNVDMEKDINPTRFDILIDDNEGFSKTWPGTVLKPMWLQQNL